MKRIKSQKTFEGFSEIYEHDSALTHTPMKFALYRPQGQARGGLIWLSGLSCSEENFITKAGAQRVLSELKLALICPDTSPRGLDLPAEHEAYDFGSGAGFYVDALTVGYKDHYKMQSYIVEELYNLFDAEFGLQQNISLMGHSMGGHGALVAGLRNPQKFKSLSAFAPISHPSECAWGRKAFGGYLGEDPKLWAAYDACALLQKGQLHPAEILVDQGLADEFLEKGQLLPEHLEAAAKSAGQKLSLNYHEGFDHSYYFIATFIEKHLRFHARHLAN